MGEFQGIRTNRQRPRGKWQQVGGKFTRDDDAVRTAKTIAKKENVDTYVSAETYSDTLFVFKKISEGVKMKKSELKELIKECHQEIISEKLLKEEILNEDFAGGLTTALGVLGAITAVGVAGTALKFGLYWLGTKTEEAKEKQMQKARRLAQQKYMDEAQSIADKFKDDSTLASLLKDLAKYPYANKKTRNERSKVLAKINSHVKTKLDKNEIRYLKDVNALIRE